MCSPLTSVLKKRYLCSVKSGQKWPKAIPLLGHYRPKSTEIRSIKSATWCFGQNRSKVEPLFGPYLPKSSLVKTLFVFVQDLCSYEKREATAMYQSHTARIGQKSAKSAKIIQDTI